MKLESEDSQSHGRRQRALHHALADIVPLEYGFIPTLGLGTFENRNWILNLIEFSD